MADVRIPSIPLNFDGRTFQLFCNMNVLADVQEAYDGNLIAALRNPASLKVFLTFLTATLNDYADSQGWDLRYTVRQVGRILEGNHVNLTLLSTEVSGLIRKSVTNGSTKEDDNDPKN